MSVTEPRCILRGIGYVCFGEPEGRCCQWCKDHQPQAVEIDAARQVYLRAIARFAPQMTAADLQEEGDSIRNAVRGLGHLLSEEARP